MIENVPYWVRVEKARMEYRRREALKVGFAEHFVECHMALVVLETRVRRITSQGLSLE